MKPYYSHAGITIYHGDCREILPGIKADAVVTDPPYGMGWDTDCSRFSGGKVTGHGYVKSGAAREQVVGDDEELDPTPWLGFGHVILWGANHYAQRLPVGTTLVWIKRNVEAFGSFLSDAEVAWMKGGYGVYCFRDLSMTSDGRRGVRVHPCQKPQPLMRWCIEKTEGVVLDPFMGSGTTLRAAKDLGRKAIGIEIEERYCEIAAKRLAQEVLDFEGAQ